MVHREYGNSKHDAKREPNQDDLPTLNLTLA